MCNSLITSENIFNVLKNCKTHFIAFIVKEARQVVPTPVESQYQRYSDSDDKSKTTSAKNARIDQPTTSADPKEQYDSDSASSTAATKDPWEDSE